jgi:predicted metalloprotease with PDZ domain
MNQNTVYLILSSLFILVFFTDAIWAQEETSQFYTIYHFGVQNGETVTSGDFKLQRTKSQLNVIDFSSRGSDIMRNPIGYTIQHLIGQPQAILEFPVKTGKSWSGELAGIGPFVGAKGWTAKTTVEGTAEEVTVHAGVFSDCAHLVTTITGSGKDQDGNPAPEMLDKAVRGIRHFWFAPCVGPVKCQYQHADGSTTNIELLEYSHASKSTDLFPLAFGNTWKYRWTNTKHAAMVEESWVAAEGAPSEGIASLPENLALRYTVKISDPKLGQIHISASIKNFPKDACILEMQQNWAEGENLPGNIRNLEITNIDSGKPTFFRANGTWLVNGVSKKEMKFDYTLEPKQRDFLHVEEEPTLTDQYCFIFGYGLFIIPKLGDRHYRAKIDIQVDFQAPDEWQIATTWGSRQKSYHPSSLHELRHAMMALGDYRLHTYKILGKDFTMSIRDAWPFTDEEYLQNAMKYVESYAQMFNDYPVPYFLIILNKGGEGQGDKTNNSLSVVHNDRSEPPDQAKRFYFSQMNIPHEIFHIWEGKIKGTGGTRWVHEGFPSYYALKAFDQLHPKETEEERQAAEEVLLNELNRWYSYDNSKSLEVPGADIYRKGALVALMLDVTIQEKIGGQKSLDDLVAQMYHRFGPGSEAEYTNQDVFAIVSALAGEDMRWFYDRYIVSTTELLLEEALGYLGYAIERKLGPIADFGMTLSGNFPWRVESVREGGPAYEAGIKVGDTIIGYYWPPQELSARREPLDASKQFEAMFPPGHPARLDVMSGGKTSVVTVKPDAQPNEAYISKIQKAKK